MKKKIAFTFVFASFQGLHASFDDVQGSVAKH